MNNFYKHAIKLNEINLNTVNLSLSPQEQQQFYREQYEQNKEDLRLALTELEKQQQEIGFALQPGLQEKQAQLTNYAKLLQKAEDLTSRFNEVKSQQDHLQGPARDPCFTEVEWLGLKHQHENLLSQLKVRTSLSLSTRLLECLFALFACVVIQMANLWVKPGVVQVPLHKSRESSLSLSLTVGKRIPKAFISHHLLLCRGINV